MREFDLEERLIQQNKRILEANIVMRVLSICVLIMFISIGIRGLYALKYLDRAPIESFDDKKLLSKISEIESVIDENYLYDIDMAAVEEGIYKGLMGSLDRYSRYIPVGETNKEAEGKIGITTAQDKTTKYIKIVEIDKRSPLINCDIKAGDLIYGVDDNFINSYTNYEAFISSLKGEIGSEVTLHIVDRISGKTKEVKTTRVNLDEIKVTSNILKDTNIGYIRVYEFAPNTSDAFIAVYNEVLAKNIEGLIIDLRDNPGGSVSVVAKILEPLTPNGILIELEDKNGQKETYEDKNDIKIEIPLVVLVNENSASGSEAFVEAIKHYDVGTVLGTVTYGKGVSQKQILLADGSSINITRAKVLTPSGDCIHGTGSVPDILLEFDNQKYEETKFDNQIAAAKEEIQNQLSKNNIAD